MAMTSNPNNPSNPANPNNPAGPADPKNPDDRSGRTRSDRADGLDTGLDDRDDQNVPDPNDPDKFKFDKLVLDMRRETRAEAAVTNLLRTIAGEITKIAESRKRGHVYSLEELAAEITNHTEKLSQAVTANTPAQ